MLLGNADFSGEEREHYVSLLSDSLSFKEAYILGIYGRTYQFNYAEKKISEVLTYMNRRRLWQKDVIQDVFRLPKHFLHIQSRRQPGQQGPPGRIDGHLSSI